MKNILFYMSVVLLLTSCATCKQGAIYTKKARWVGGNAKAFQQRHDAKLKKTKAATAKCCKF